jgi:hypothetical protein
MVSKVVKRTMHYTSIKLMIIEMKKCPSEWRLQKSFICDLFSFWYRRTIKFKLESDIQQKISVVIRGTIPKVLYWNLYFSSLLKCNANKFVTSKLPNES